MNTICIKVGHFKDKIFKVPEAHLVELPEAFALDPQGGGLTHKIYSTPLP